MSPQGTSEIRVRFAPSPTGFLHVGGVRTALYNYLYARGRGGKYMLRIEDTDLERSEQRFTDDILASLKWLGLEHDEEILYQSRRLDEARRKAEELVAKGHAYRCTCTEAEVDAMRKKAEAEGRKPMYDRSCRDKNLPAGDRPFVIRAKLPLDGFVEFDDLIRGPIRIQNVEMDDFVLIRTNGAPIYNLAVVVDEMHMRITHVIRGEDHINNTPKQIHLYRFFGYPVPQFGHLPMILGEDKKKLSKRHGAVSANYYREEGYLPETLLNFLVRLGWSHGDQEVFSREEMIRHFGFDHVQKTGAVFNLEKLQWLNGVHIRAAKPERLAEIVTTDYARIFVAPGSLEKVSSAMGVRLIALIQPKVKLIKELADQLVPLCTSGAVDVDASGLKWNKDAALKPAVASAVREARAHLAGLSRGGESLLDAGVTHETVDQYFRALCERHGLKLGDLAQPLRLFVSGRSVSAGIFELITVLPWASVDARLGKLLEAAV